MTSNISTTDTTVPPKETRATLTADVVGQLTSWNPREWTRALRHWHRGSISLVHLDVLMVLEEYGPTSMGRLAESGQTTRGPPERECSMLRCRR